MNSSEFFEKLRQNPRPVVIDVWAPWCAPCRAMAPALQQVSGKYEGKVDLWKVNTDELPEVAAELRVMGIPTMIGFADGQELVRKTGMQQADALEIFFEATLHQRGTVILPPTNSDRVLRSGAGLILIALGITQALLLPAAVGAVVLFSAFYDRCPVFRTIYPRMKDWIDRLQLPIG